MKSNTIPDPAIFLMAVELMDSKRIWQERYCCLALLAAMYRLGREVGGHEGFLSSPEYLLFRKLNFIKWADSSGRPWFKFEFLWYNRKKALLRCALIAQCMQEKANAGATGDPASWGCD